MKRFAVLMMLYVLSLSLHAQQVEAPQKEFILKAPTSAVEVKAGSSTALQVIRSKSFQHGEASFGTSSSLPEGVTLQVDARADDLQVYDAVIKTTAGVSAGTYSVVLNCTIHHKTKAVIVKLQVI
ncbi:MAG TPA: hypothetical protein VIN08_00010 [Ohtaekwangia sp.]|uniref:hypothetical protein n=1 Tax=Ohtaekwangia sp. TaxID=2066019 RepID=UPI002F93F234